MKKSLNRILMLVLMVAVVMSMSAVSFAATGTASAKSSSARLADGTYTVNVRADADGSGRMFYIASVDKNKCRLTVKNGKMTAMVRLDGTGYDKLFMGKAADAATNEAAWIDYKEDSQGYYNFNVPVTSFGKAASVAAYGVKGKAWHDHTLTFSFTASQVTPGKTTLKTVKGVKRGAKLSWKSQKSPAAGYQIRYSLYGSMAKSKIIKVSGSKTTSKTISKLKSKKKYYFQIRTYNSYGSKTYCSGWSAKKSVRVR